MIIFRIKKILTFLKVDILFKKMNDMYIERIHKSLKKRYPGSEFYGNCIISDLDKFHIGRGSILKEAYIESSGGVYIGEYVHSGINLTIFSTNHNYKSKNKIPYDEEDIVKPVTINDFVWIGANVSIVPGITVGEGAIIGMGAVVTTSVPKCAIVGGNPAHVIGWRDVEVFNTLKLNEKFY